MDNFDIEKNKNNLLETIKKFGKSKLSFEQKEIDTLARSKSFSLTGYLRQLILLNRSIDKDHDFKIEKALTKEFNELRNEYHKLKDENILNKRFKNIESKTNYGLPFYLMQGYLDPRVLRKVEKMNPEVAYKLDNEIERRSKKSRYFKSEPERAYNNAVLNVFRDEFPNSVKNGITKATLAISDANQTVSRAAAITMYKVFNSGAVSGLVSKMANRVDSFTERFKIKTENKWWKRTKDLTKIAASAAAIAIVGHESFELLNNLPELANISFDDFENTKHLLASVDVSGVQESKEVFINNDIVYPKGIDISALNMDNVKVDSVVEKTNDIKEFMMNKEMVTTLQNFDNLEELAKHHLDNPSIEDIQKFVSAVSEYNDIDNPNVIDKYEEILIPSDAYFDNFKIPSLDLNISSKEQALESMKNVNIYYGETKSTLIEKLISSAEESGAIKNIERFKELLNEKIPVDLKAHDLKVTENIKKIVEGFEKLQSKPSFKLK